MASLCGVVSATDLEPDQPTSCRRVKSQLSNGDDGSIDPSEIERQDLNQQLEQALSALSAEDLEAMAASERQKTEADEHGRIRGTIIDIRGVDVFVDIGGKAEAIVPIDEFEPDQ